jgi:acetolactate synthase-1/2/3 large subunit
MQTGAELFVRAMEQLRLQTLFTLVGDHLNEVLRAAADAGIRIIDMRHESAVTHAADAYARATREPALSLVTGGPGHTNSLTGIATAYLNLSPIIAVSGSRSNAIADRGAFQDIDQIGMARPVVKWAAEPHSPGQIPFYLSRAYAEANSGRKGPVHLSIPTDLFSATAQSQSPAAFPVCETAAAPDDKSVARAIELMRSAQRPVVIAGSGIWWSRAEHDLVRFIEHTGFPLYTATLAKGAVPDDHPLCFGYPDPTLNRAAKRAFAEADLFVIVGKRIDFRLALGGPKLLSPDARVIQIDIHAAELGLNRKLDLAICADARLTLRRLTAAAGEKPWSGLPCIEDLKRYRAEWLADLEARAANAGRPLEHAPLHPAVFFFELRKHLPRETILSWDGGDFVQWGRAIIPATGPGRWLRLGPLGTIGAGFPNALALQAAHPDRRVVMITGDGSLGFYIAEMDTAVRHKLPVVIIVGNDAGWGMERELQGGGNTVACELRETCYDKVMEGFGGAGETIESASQIGPALNRAFQAGVPYLINVRIRGVASPFTEWNLSSRR